MGDLKQRLQRSWADWNVEATPGIYLVVTLFGAFVFSGLALAFSAIGFVGVGQILGGPLPASLEFAIYVPAFAILVLWLLYRYKWYRVIFPLRKEPKSE